MSHTNFLPVCKADMQERGWEQLDFLYISGDAYVDHPSFGHAIITRVLENAGYRVGIIAQPDWNSKEDFLKMGTPRLGVLISSGVIDSMVNHYTAAKKKRSEDKYAPGGKAGMRPDRAVIVYSTRVRAIFKGVPVIIGGIEASLRRFAHYDFWQNEVRASVLQDSKADIMIYGMGERPIIEIAELLDKGVSIDKIQNVRGTCYIAASNHLPEELQHFVEQYEIREKAKKEADGDSESEKISKNSKHKLNSVISAFYKDKDKIIINTLREVREDKLKYAASFYVQYTEQDSITGRTILQKHMSRYLVQNPPAEALAQDELDRVYSLPYVKACHPQYNEMGGVPALEEVEFSVASQRGCFGACSFCALNFHQGRVIQSRSHESIIEEVKGFIDKDNFKGYINDVGGPTANFREVSCKKQETHGMCKDKRCLFPTPCKNLEVSHKDYLSLLRKLKQIEGVKKVFIRSGIRYDYLMYDENLEFFNELCKDHISGQLKVAPEHISENVLKRMGKPGKNVYDRFTKKYFEINKRLGKNQFLVPYFISGHPGSTLDDAIELALYIKEMGYTPEQVQQFYPTPGTLSTCMYYSEIDPLSGENIYVAKSEREKAMQRALLQVSRPQNHQMVLAALKLAGRTDLIGMGKHFLIAPRLFKHMSKETTIVDNRSNSKNSSRNNNQKSSSRNQGGSNSKTPNKSRPTNRNSNGNKNSSSRINENKNNSRWK